MTSIEPQRRPSAAYNSPHDPEKTIDHKHTTATKDTTATDTDEPINVGQNAAEQDFPEGGLQAWLVVFGSFCSLLTVFGMVNMGGIFESHFSRNQLKDHSSSQIAWIFGLYLFIVFFVGIQVGPVFDRYGPRILVTVGGLLVASSVLILSVCQKYYQIMLAYAVLGGLGGALLNTPAYGTVAHYFNKKRGLAIGIASMAGGFGGIVFPIILQRLIPTLGFGWAVRVLGFILLALTLPPILLVRSRFPPRHNDNASSSSIWPDFSICRDPRFALSAVGMFFVEWGLFVPLTYIVSYGVRYSDDPTDSYVLISITCSGSVLGRLIPGFLADKLGRFNTLIITLVLCVVVIFALWLPAGSNNSMLMAFAALFGFSCGSNLGLIPVCIGQLCEVHMYGRYLSTALMLGSFGTLTSLPIAGAILEAGGHSDAAWNGLIIFAGVSYILCLGCYVAVRVIAVGWSPKALF